MGKILFWIIVILVALVAARVITRNNARNQEDQEPSVAKDKAAPLQGNPESMVRCEHCGIHLPRSEALLSGGRTWCSQEHAKLGDKTRV